MASSVCQLGTKVRMAVLPSFAPWMKLERSVARKTSLGNLVGPGCSTPAALRKLVPTSERTFSTDRHHLSGYCGPGLPRWHAPSQNLVAAETDGFVSGMNSQTTATAMRPTTVTLNKPAA
jgi:hypothetical protein